jgi:hypothetical protein
MKHILLGTCLLWAMVSSALFAQKTVTISGYIKDAATGETLIGATVYAVEQQVGAAANEYGFYSLSLKPDSVTLQFSFVGYQTYQIRTQISADKLLNIELSTEADVLNEVVIEADAIENKVNSTQMSVDKVSVQEAKVLPVIFGEVDIIKTLQLKPGVVSGGEGTSAIVVRGGGPDQNLIKLDEAVVYNPAHLFGFFSTFNSDALKDAEIYKGGFPAQYGGRLSSVIDVKLKDGNYKRFGAQGGIGLIASRLTLEGPIVKDKASFMVAGRRTYADLITKGVNKLNEGDSSYQKIPDYYFYDLNSKLNFNLGNNNRLFVSGYFGRDKFGVKFDDFEFGFDWGNTTLTTRWNHIYNPKLFSNVTFTFSDYLYTITSRFDVFNFELGSGIRDANLALDYYWSPTNAHQVRFGGEATHHWLNIGRFKGENENDDQPLFNTSNDMRATDFGAYLSDDITISRKLSLNAGIRLSGMYSDTSLYTGIEPRAALKYSITPNVSLKASYTRMYQYLHLISNSGASLPTDVWYPSTTRIKPQRSDLAVLGISLKIADQYLLTNEVYYKWQKNQIDFRDGADLFFNNDLEDEFVVGTGTAFGNEIYFEKTKGQLTGWIGYTIADAWRTFNDINNGQKFRPRYAQRHTASIVAMYQLSPKWSFAGTWVFNTGNFVSLPIGRFLLQDVDAMNFNIGNEFLDRNSFEMPAYHRLDLSVVMKIFMKRKDFSGDITFSSYNTYDRRNPYFIYYDIERDKSGNPTNIVPKQVSLFPILPSVTFNFKY